VGMAELPWNLCVEIEAILAFDDGEYAGSYRSRAAGARTRLTSDADGTTIVSDSDRRRVHRRSEAG